METYPLCPSPTFLDAVLQVVDNGRQDSGETHDLGTLGQAKGEELVPACPHQAGVAVLPGDIEVRVGAMHVGTSPSPSMSPTSGFGKYALKVYDVSKIILQEHHRLRIF